MEIDLRFLGFTYRKKPVSPLTLLSVALEYPLFRQAVSAQPG